MQATKRFRETLALHARILTRMKNAGEGLIQAVARDVEKTRAAAAPMRAWCRPWRAPPARCFTTAWCDLLFLRRRAAASMLSAD